MQPVKAVRDHVGSREEKFFKNTLFSSETMLLGINCLEPGQIQKPHDHADQDKFYYVIEGEGQFQIGEETKPAKVGDVVWAPAGIIHGVSNEAEKRLTLLVGIAPAP